MMSQLKWVEKEAKDPLSEEPPILRLGGCGGPIFNIEGISKYFYATPYLHPCLVLTARRGCAYSKANGPQSVPFSWIAPANKLVRQGI